MSSRVFFGILLSLLLIGMLILAFNIQPVRAQPSTIIVPSDYPTIQAAVNAAQQGDNITVMEGIYYENVVVNKSVALVGTFSVQPIIENNFTGVAVWIQAPNVTVSGFMIRNSQTGILLDHSNNSQIYGNVLAFNSAGAILNNSCNNVISSNVLLSNVDGIGIAGSSCNNTIERNEITQGYIGINVSYSASNNTVIDNSIIGYGNDEIQYGVQISSTSDNVISGNTIIANRYGISISWSADITATDNTLIRNTHVGYSVGFGDQGYSIYLDHADNCSFDDNELDLNMIGFYFWECRNCTLSGNILKDNDVGFQMWGSSLEYYLHTIDTSNTVNGRPIYYLINQHGVVVPNDAGWVATINCSDIAVEDLTTVPNFDGVLFAYTEDSVIIDSTLSNNFDAVMLSSSSNCTVSRNVISNNGYAAIYFDGSVDCTMTENNVLYNFCVFGMRHNSTENRIFHNNFINNSWIGSFDPCQNSMDNGISEGNYWTGYNGIDSNNDGIGDTSYSLCPSNNDNYPLMGTFSDFNVTLEHYVQTVSNSTISDFQFNGTAISFNASGENWTTGFCRTCIPTALIKGTYRVFVNGAEVPYTLLPESNSTNSYLYFTYHHLTQEVTITPEFPSFLILPLFLIATLLTAIAYKKRTNKKN
ncbi:MAG: NosD domain-containing protein [Candidatus Bathyarchaeia archaeon]